MRFFFALSVKKDRRLHCLRSSCCWVLRIDPCATLEPERYLRIGADGCRVNDGQPERFDMGIWRRTVILSAPLGAISGQKEAVLDFKGCASFSLLFYTVYFIADANLNQSNSFV